jgi:membrane protease YdiL (CAAX protease family)
MMKQLTSFIQRRPLLTYFLLAYAFSWAFTPLIAISPVYGLPALFAPALAAIIVSGVTGGRPQVGLLLRKLAIWRVGLVWYLVALGLPFLISYVASAPGKFFKAESSFELAPITPLGIVVFVLVIGEELGWRGFAQPELEKHVSPLVAAILLGVLWGFWHLPNFFIPGLPHYEIPLPAFVLYTTGLSVLAAWLLKHARGTILLTTLLHGSTNTFGFLTPGLDTATRWWLIALVYAIAAFVIALIYGRGLNRDRSLGSAGPSIPPAIAPPES